MQETKARSGIRSQTTQPVASHPKRWPARLVSCLIKTLRFALGYLILCLRLSPLIAAFLDLPPGPVSGGKNPSEVPHASQHRRLILLLVLWICLVILLIVLGAGVIVGVFRR